jgi:hypothetical protein
MAGQTRTHRFRARIAGLGEIGNEALAAGVRNQREFDNFTWNRAQNGERISATTQFAQVSAKIGAMPAALQAGFVAELKAFDPQLLSRVKRQVPKRKGPPPSLYERRWRAAGGGATLLTTRLDASALRLSVGLLTPDARKRAFYLYILDAGRGQKARRSRASVRYLGDAPSLVRGFEGQQRGRYSVRYSRAISPISPTTYDITFGTVRYWARGEIGPALDRVYVRALARVGGW